MTCPGVDRTGEAVKELRRADLIVVLDICDLGRLGMLSETVRDRGVPVACMDHHISTGVLPAGPRYLDPTAAATGELIFELAVANDWPMTEAAARGLYVALLTDTGGFRFSNTRPRTLRIAAELLEAGVDPEEIYLEVYARAPEGRPRLFAEALQTLVVEPEHGLAWVTVPPGAIERLGVSSDDLEGVVEFPRSIEGVRMALLFREVSAGPGEGLAPVGGQRGCGGLRQALRRRRAHQGRRSRASRDPGRGAGHRARRRARLPRPQWSARRQARLNLSPAGRIFPNILGRNSQPVRHGPH